MTTAIDAKTAARQRVRAFLAARQSYAASLGHSGFVADEITRQIRDAGTTSMLVSFDSSVTDVQPPMRLAEQPVPLLASDLAILAADD